MYKNKIVQTINNKQVKSTTFSSVELVFKKLSTRKLSLNCAHLRGLYTVCLGGGGGGDQPELLKSVTQNNTINWGVCFVVCNNWALGKRFRVHQAAKKKIPKGKRETCNHRAIEMRINGPRVDRLFSPDDDDGVGCSTTAADFGAVWSSSSSSCGPSELFRFPVINSNPFGWSDLVSSLLRRRIANSDLF